MDMNTFPITRRRMLGLSAAALASTFLPPNLRRALAADTPRPLSSFSDIKHVVLLMQENRSFDHYFGTMAGVRGFSDPHALVLDNGKSVFYQPDVVHPDGYILPFHLDTSVSSAQKIPSTSHEWHVQHESCNGGKMDQWLQAHRKADKVNGPFVMGYHTRADIPFQFALAEAFTICDAYHCSVLGPTRPNRLYWMTGTIDGDGMNGGPVIDNAVPAPGRGFRWTTYAERLEQAGVSWKVYQEPYDCGFDLNVLTMFENFRNLKPGSPLHDRALVQSSADQFERDAMNDKLPAVSWLMPPMHLSEHPDFTPADGAAFVAKKIDAIAANPEVWAKTVFILDYDENDGLFDHVAPPSPPPGTAGEFAKGVPIGGGFRVPCIIVSPWTAGGWVCSQPFDHTSPLQFLEKVTGVKETNITDWRRQTFGDLTAAFHLDKPSGKPPVLPDANKLLAKAQSDIAHLPRPSLPGSSQTPPVQEPGLGKRIPTV
jgi:phospholipase C